MNYNEEIDKIVKDFQHPCDAEVPAGSYRRVKWEKYNTDLSNRSPAVGEEWETEIIPITKRVYDKNPFGLLSEPIPEQQATGPGGEPVPCAGVLSKKIGVCFASQQALADYVKSIGSTLQADNNWYGADLSKANLFKRTEELAMYRLENTGATWSRSGPRVDKRTCMRFDQATSACTAINFDGVYDHRTAYLKHYEDKPCAYVGMTINTNVDTSIPGVPVAIAVAVAALPLIPTGCIPADFGFPYTNISQSIIKAWNKTKHNFKLYWDALPGLTEGLGDRIATMYDNLSVSMEELGQASLAMSQYAMQLAFAEFKKVISAALNIVGGGWELIKRFLPKPTILGVEIDIIDLCTSPDGVKNLKKQLKGNAEQIIKSIYDVIGSSYRYAVEYVKMTARDIVDAITDLYDWAWTQLQMAGVALCKLLGELAQIWSMPPEVPNPVWLAIKAVREILMQIKPLDIILSGNFPGFTASELYDQCMTQVKKERDQIVAEYQAIKDQITHAQEELKNTVKELNEKVRYYQQYLNRMWEKVTEETTAFYERQINQLKDKKQEVTDRIAALDAQGASTLDKIKDCLSMGLEQLKKLPMMKPITDLLEMAGATVDSILEITTNVTTGCKSLYEDFVDGSRSLKDICKTIFNQISTLCISKVTQWVNKLLSIIGLVINFPSMSFCTPMIEY